MNLSAIVLAGAATATLALATAPPKIPQAAMVKARDHVVLVAPVLPAYLTLDGGAGHIAAASIYPGKAGSERLAAKVFPGLRATSRLPAIQTAGLDPEALMQLHPDAVVAFKAQAENLRHLGLPGVPLSPAAGERFYPTLWRQLALVAGQPKREQALEARYDRFQAQVVGRVSGSAARAPSAAFIWQPSPGVYRLAVKGHAVAALIRKLGVRNAADQAGLLFPGQHVDADAEQLLRIDPDIIILSCCDGEPLAPSDLYASPVFAHLKAVRSRHIYKQPQGGAQMEGLVEQPLMLEWLAGLFYPSRVDPRAFPASFAKTYADVYGYRMTQADLDVATFAVENAVSDPRGFRAED